MPTKRHSYVGEDLSSEEAILVCVEVGHSRVRTTMLGDQGLLVQELSIELVHLVLVDETQLTKACLDCDNLSLVDLHQMLLNPAEAELLGHPLLLQWNAQLRC